MLMRDLESAPPAYILDTSPGDCKYAFPPERYPPPLGVHDRALSRRDHDRRRPDVPPQLEPATEPRVLEMNTNTAIESDVISWARV